MEKKKIQSQKISTCLWFNNNAEEAVKFYSSVFKNSEVGKATRYGKGAPMPEGTILTIPFNLEGQDFLALNGGAAFTFSEAVSFIINCETQQEIDYFWEKLSEGGQIQQCGWLKDQFGVSWQVTPSKLGEMLQSGDSAKSARVFEAVMKMVKLDMEEIEEAYKG